MTGSVDGPFDPAEFPILGELEEEFRSLVAQRLAEDRAAARAAEPRRFERAPTADPEPRTRRRAGRAGRAIGGEHLRTGRRIVRRAALVGALIGAVGATALAAKSVVQGGPDHASSAILHRDGAHGLTLRRDHGRLCLDLTADGAVATRCAAPPHPSAVDALSAVAAGGDGRVLAGITGARVDRARIVADGRTTIATTRPLAGADGARWFAVTIPPHPDGRRPGAATVTPLDTGGAPAGRTAVDCSLGTAASCRAAMERER